MNLTNLAQLVVGHFLREGELAIDATVGNGHDTLFLARRVGPAGSVIGFDVQEIALEKTRERLEQAGVLGERVTLFRRSHCEMGEVLDGFPELAAPKAIMFNLGYLPGSDKTVTTETAETLEALEAAAGLLAVGGVLTAALYAGHPEGVRETEAALKWAAGLPIQFRVYCTRLHNRAETAPSLLSIEKQR